MYYLIRLSIALAALAVIAAEAPAQPGEEIAEALAEPPSVDTPGPTRPGRIGITWENDSPFHTLLDSEDADYTEGLRIDFSWRPEFARRWAEKLPLADDFKDPRAAVGISIGQNLYTPEDLSAVRPDPDDRPYGAWLYTGFYIQRADETKLDHLELDIGVTGEWAGGKPTQKTIHRLVKSQDPKGWDTQIGEEVGANLVLGRTWKHGWGAPDNWRGDILPYVGAVAGTINVNVNGGITGRLGYNMTDDFGGSRVGRVGDQTSDPRRGLGGYLFARLGGRAVAHDTFLDGSLFRNDDPEVGHERLVGEAQLGVVVSVTGWLDVGYSQTWWSKEYQSQGHGEHFAAYTFNIHFEF